MARRCGTRSLARRGTDSCRTSGRCRTSLSCPSTDQAHAHAAPLRHGTGSRDPGRVGGGLKARRGTSRRHAGGERRGAGRAGMGKLQDRVAVVTGAASGIGYGIAVAFAAEGADVAVVDTATEEQAAGVLADIKAHGRQALFVRCDVSDEAAVRAMARQVLDRFTRVDVLVNNAGVFTQSLLADMPVADWDRVLNVNLRGTFLCTRVLIGQMLDRGWGRVINIASQLGQIGGVEVAHYSASKAGIIGFTKARLGG